MIIWIEGATFNPWLVGIYIIIIGGYYYFNSNDAPPSNQWIGPWGVCSAEDGRMYE